jgi:hypothetical protein
LERLTASLIVRAVDFYDPLKLTPSCDTIAAFHSRQPSFPVAGPRIWNDLPEEVTSAQSLSIFRQRQKTFLFSASYPDLII